MQRANANISHAARLLKTSRRALRDALKDLDMYPWPHPSIDRPAVPEERPPSTYASEPGVAEDGTAGVVRFRFKTQDSGTVLLDRGDDGVPL